MDRRYFLKNSGIALASFGAVGLAPDFLRQFANAATVTDAFGKKKILVTIFQRGAVDGLNMIVPHGDSDYYNIRRNIAVPKPGRNEGAIDLDGFFGFHPAMASLEKFWKSKQLAVINSAGSPDNTRSHFDAQDYMESGTPGYKATRDGWLNRVLQLNPKEKTSPFRAVSMTQQVPRTLMGRYPTVAMTNLQTFAIRAGAYTSSVQGGFEGIWQQQADDRLGETGKETFEAINYLKKANPAQYSPENGARYPAGPFGNNLRQIAQLIKAGVGLEAAFSDTPGLNWDTHINQANQNGSRGQLANLLRIFSQALAAFATDLGKDMDDVLILTMSEFGRTAQENGSRGTDHGHGNAMIAIGNSVNGGRVYGDWKGLKPSQLDRGRYLAVTTDFRDVFAEAAGRHLAANNLDKVFPRYTVDPSKRRGFIS
ncbi:MAG: DUF1501 domain-containing protein [Acidobacteriota bacterium]|nr:DUF1501 domain-containing protein [Acidobacteriota bacterium]